MLWAEKVKGSLTRLRGVGVAIGSGLYDAPVPIYPFTCSSFAGIALAQALLATAPAAALEADSVVTGAARVLDGDTIEIGETRVRLFGIDAPETAQMCMNARRLLWPCGVAAARRLERLLKGTEALCRGRGVDEHGRLLAICTAEGRHLNAQLVQEGLAWAFVRYSDIYVAIEREARVTKSGVFAADNTPPWEFRSEKREGAQKTVEADKGRDCRIKGNIARDGERIYHMPWQRDYGRVTINESAGERCFCNEGEAERGGWRRAAQ
jgi:endonuclease YncB( thermonuclease family)